MSRFPYGAVRRAPIREIGAWRGGTFTGRDIAAALVMRNPAMNFNSVTQTVLGLSYEGQLKVVSYGHAFIYRRSDRWTGPGANR